ncbi:sensor histidine kinase [Chakrabartyella piscis]|uniref:sensor histidine kinase n=1 Tax=Chakrabartyella piscis TaxID=2918914 RepID=UPI0029583856|nr:histidine kinase [Chakrabartyella piscis]
MKPIKYISHRFFFVGICVFVLFLQQTIYQIILWASGATSPLPLLWLICAFVVLCSYGWFRVLLPYRKAEKMMQRFLDGYELMQPDLEKTFLTPSSEKELYRIHEMLHSPEVYDLNKRQAQYLALQNQINPHFLYNTLESIRGEALIEGLDSVADMTEALATFFRYTISKVENLVSVEEELENCRTYFRIQKYRFGERLQLHITYDEEEWEQIRHYRMPKLTLQPILENSIIHGTELKIGTGNLHIQFECTEKRLLIRISDDGIGMDEETLWKLNRKLRKDSSQVLHKRPGEKGGIALVNVNNRIHLIFGEEYGMHVYSIQGKGTDVEISIPVIVSDREVSDRGVLS